MTSEFGIAVHAMVFLHHKGDMVSSEVLAENICTNPARVRKVMAQLKRAGLVETHEGAVGGYRFEGSAATVTLCRRSLHSASRPVYTSSINAPMPLATRQGLSTSPLRHDAETNAAPTACAMSHRVTVSAEPAKR